MAVYSRDIEYHSLISTVCAARKGRLTLSCVNQANMKMAGSTALLWLVIQLIAVSVSTWRQSHLFPFHQSGSISCREVYERNQCQIWLGHLFNCSPFGFDKLAFMFIQSPPPIDKNIYYLLDTSFNKGAHLGLTASYRGSDGWGGVSSMVIWALQLLRAAQKGGVRFDDRV